MVADPMLNPCTCDGLTSSSHSPFSSSSSSASKAVEECHEIRRSIFDHVCWTQNRTSVYWTPLIEGETEDLSGVRGGGGGGAGDNGVGGGEGVDVGVGGANAGTLPTADYFSQATFKDLNATLAPHSVYSGKDGGGSGGGGGGGGRGGGGVGGVFSATNQPNNCHFDVFACEKERRCRVILR